MSPLRVLVAPSGFKESLSAEQVAQLIRRGVRRAVPGAKVRTLPLADGGEGFTHSMVATTRGCLHRCAVTGPVGVPVEASFGFLGRPRRRTAVIEMAAAAGLRHVPRELRDPTLTTTRGVGELVGRALDAGAKRLLVGCGDSGTNDAGAGMAAALGVRLLDRRGHPVRPGAAGLLELHAIDMCARDRRLDGMRVDVACNIANDLLGDRGVARVFGPQKGADAQTVLTLERALETFARVVRRDVGLDVGGLAGAGASGGLGAGLAAFLGARLIAREQVIGRFVDLDRMIARADLVITAEGGLDHQTVRGKIPGWVAQRAKAQGTPVIAITGTIGDGAGEALAVGIATYATIVHGPCTLSEAIGDAPELVTDCVDRVMRAVTLGAHLPAGIVR